MKKIDLQFFLVIILSLSFCVCTHAQDIDLDKGLIGYYKFNGDAEDASGNNNHGIKSGVNHERDVTGESGGSFRWNDDNDQIKIPIDMNPVSLPRVTLCAWVKITGYSSDLVVISNDDGGGDRKICTSTNNRKRVWAISDGKGGYIGETVIERKKWIFLVATYDNNSQRAAIYVNGRKTSGHAKVDMGTDYILIGANPRGNDDFKMLIDEVRIYDRILKKSEIDSLQKLITPEPPEEEVEEDYYYLAEMKMAAKSSPSKNAADIGVIEKGDTLKFKEQVPAAGGKYNEYLKIEIDGKTAYVPLKYLEKETISEGEMTKIERYLGDHMQWDKWFFWVALVVMAIVGFVGTFKFAFIDGVLARMTGNADKDFEGGASIFPIATAIAGFIMAFIIIIWQSSVEYYFTNFSIWPVGYGFSTWLVWLILLALTVVFVYVLYESFTCGNILHGFLRIIALLILGFLTFVPVFIITVAVIIIVIVVVVGLFLISVAFSSLLRR